MCGITGIIANKERSEKVIDKMVDVITHRGPDDRGTFIDERFAFGMRRLSIIDVAHGHQPISNEDDTVTIVFNGEIYNYRELKPHLISLGHRFKTDSDTEGLVHLYEQYGPDMLKKIRGMFGFCIFDKKKNQLFIARDFFGIKPIYYRLDKNGRVISFGSEIKSLLEDGENNSEKNKPKVNDNAVYNYLAFQYNPLEETMFEGIYRLLPGHFMVIDLADSSFKIEPYWHYHFNKQEWPSQNDADEKSLADEIKKVVEDSVEHHLISDVPVGSFLSGGVDSGIIVTTVQNMRKKAGAEPVSTFTIGFDHVSEGEEAKQVSSAVGSDHNEIKIKFDEYYKELPKIAWHFDEPVADPSAVALYFLAREARKKVKVVLSGEGADELFGGYNIYREPFDTAYLRNLPAFLKTTFLEPLLRLPFNFYGKNYIRRSLTAIEDRYIGNAYIFRPREQDKMWLKKDSKNSTETDRVGINRVDMKPYFDTVKGESDSRKMQYIDLQFWLPGDILAKADKMTMAHSLELRVPFLDIEVAKISSKIPDSYKYKNGTTKYILRKAFESVLPKETSARKKLGFPTPVKQWLKENPEDILKTIRENEYIKKNFNLDYINELADAHLKGKADNSRKIYTLLMFALWYNTFIKS